MKISLPLVAAMAMIGPSTVSAGTHYYFGSDEVTDDTATHCPPPSSWNCDGNISSSDTYSQAVSMGKYFCYGFTSDMGFKVWSYETIFGTTDYVSWLQIRLFARSFASLASPLN